MFFEAGDEVRIEVNRSSDDGRWIVYVYQRGNGSPIVYLGSICTELYKGEMFKGLHDGEVIVVELKEYNNLSDMQNKFLTRKQDGKVVSTAKVIVKLEFDTLYSEMSEKYFLELMKDRNDGLDRKLNYRKQYEEIVKENGRLKKDIDKFKRLKNKLINFDWEGL